MYTGRVGWGGKLKPKKHIAAADGSAALQKSAQMLGVPSAAGVAHWKYLFTPLSSIRKLVSTRTPMTF